MSARSTVDRFHKGQLICSISQEELANVVGASRVMVNKILNSFVDLGLIGMARKKITVLNEYELNRIGNYNWNKYPRIIASSTGNIIIRWVSLMTGM
jgi:predicted transcriptional regulator